ncbi:unnamed protein product [Prorocentrum cordatum]|uniref:Uncharacterized protein n=1 Tax=Prorocentrum cordatum TaxID=2364126 RepID=A0ABN9VJV7_9DINO|nr:unnamed protein product [Polarella glacialis]
MVSLHLSPVPYLIPNNAATNHIETQGAAAIAKDDEAIASTPSREQPLVEYDLGTPAVMIRWCTHASLPVGKVSADQPPNWSELPSAACITISSYWEEQGQWGGVVPSSCYVRYVVGDHVFLSCRRCFAKDIDSAIMCATFGNTFRSSVTSHRLVISPFPAPDGAQYVE